MIENSDGKREIKIYKKTFRLPTLSGGKLEQLQMQIHQRNEHLSKGRLVIKKEEQRSLFSKISKKIVEYKILKPLSLEERYEELNAIVQDYDQTVLVLKHHEYDYQKFFQELAQEIRETIGENCKAIAEKETKRQLKEQLELQKSNPNQQALAMLDNMRSQLFDIAKSTGYAAVLMLKKLDLMSESLKRIASDHDSQKQLLAQLLEEIRSQKDLYELQLEINALQAKTAEFVDIALNFEDYMKPFMGSFQNLLTNVSKVDKELSKAMDEIQNIANLLESQQFRCIETDQESLRIADFLVTGEIKKDHLQDAIKRIDNVQLQTSFEVQMSNDKGVSISECLANIREFLDLKLEAIIEIDISAITINEPNLNFDTHTSDSLNLDLGNGITLELVRVSEGKFMMGSPDGQGDSDERPQHEVNLQEFLIGKYAVTNIQWQAVMKTKGSSKYDKKFQGDLQPVVGVSWHEARAFCTTLSQQIGRDVRLPTEAEWEYAARGGNRSLGFTYAGSNYLNEIGWYAQNSGSVTHPSGQKNKNEIGIYDMSGNVWEWCLDEWHDSYADKPQNLKQQGNQAWGDINVSDNDNCSRLLRGGSWIYFAVYCRSALRFKYNARIQSNLIGFRVVCVPSS
ncbi:MAG: SUMF1/EgtB/PvdO family nonheme iron enzyme [Pseudanabaena sp. M57BS1SP1A06MG]|nr:SUMF1/EgtB/PvdO family nonheme iron enzyme [Pseudanabaena sp. M53BS1SP1A06MG]MCA6582316.1 SUMF1/EgtB/PvdO family nonheme iron enzyme [Pseudanabaena sp. M34BS1SP1A06MG]MCA6594117.1 SUMF1/EgtB/PvdO family nonheme iron enzyme [Pseudanabaena sp. M38BS1SP1A06MG]MCA6601835.1 SUMF1/EgtB/PvdO family nonheme iron enzyme [Pseudanabaena sp. M57BS1SP1A06MG]